jgi:hypothetical protein
MKISIACVLTAASIYCCISLTETGVLTHIITHLTNNALLDRGQIPVTAFIFLIAIGIIGFQGVRRKG